MRYIGNKRLLVEQIDDVIQENTKGVETFIDMFAGTGSIGKHFKKKYQVLSNDYLFFAYALQKAYIEINERPSFDGLKKESIKNPFTYFNDYPMSHLKIKDSFIYENYSPNPLSDRKYFTNENALRIDCIRLTIENWLKENVITELEFFYLLASLLEASTPISNTSGTYGAYLKNWDNRSLQPLILKELNLYDNQKNNQAFNEDANELIHKIKGDVLYLDPPYNTRQYVSNYHLLETIAKYNRPLISGVTGLPVERNKSAYSSKRNVHNALEHLVSNANANYVVMSYSTDGILPIANIEDIFRANGKSSTFKMIEIPYRRFKSNNAKQDDNILYELVFIIER